ncbi:MAG: hypothetical protein Q7T53_00585 [Deltaproteobacteria bacterium]|nr:hypothetical protein [Deltaproteobacteria bacterium]
MKKILMLATAFVLTTAAAWAADLDPTKLVTGDVQENFKDFSKEVGFGLSYFPLAPAEPLGITGFDIGIEVTAVDINENKSYWEDMGDFPGMLPVPKIHVQKGLPFGIDIGAIYSKVPDTNIQLIGGEVKWAVLKGTLATPAVAIRGSYTKLLGVDNLDLQTVGYDASISKGVAMFTPYAGVGQVMINSEPKNLPLGFTLKDEEITETKYFVGVKTKLLLLTVTAEADFAEVPAYSLRVGMGF